MSDEQKFSINGQALRVRMAILDMSWVELAARSGVSRPTLYRMEAGEDNATLGILGKVAAALDCSPVDLLSIEGFPEPTGKLAYA